jgi:hypothetical protein
VKPKPSFAPILISILALSSVYTVWGRSSAEWLGYSTAHFTVLAKGHQEQGREVIERLETARLYFEKTGWAERDAARGVELLAFYGDKEFESYRLHESAYAFYQSSPQGDYIVMRDLEPEHYSVAIHEYTHSVVEHAGLNLPVWLNEGLADFYSTLESRQAKVLLGAPPEGRDLILRNRRWMDWAVLAAVDEESPYYRQPEKMLQFYAQSWALVHMLAMEPPYADQFPKFLATVSDGATADAAFWAVYHKTLQQVGDEVVGYVRSKRMKAHWVSVDARLGSLEMQVVADARKRAEFALAEVLAANSETASEARMDRDQVVGLLRFIDPRLPAELAGRKSNSLDSPAAHLSFLQARKLLAISSGNPRICPENRDTTL